MLCKSNLARLVGLGVVLAAACSLSFSSVFAAPQNPGASSMLTGNGNIVVNVRDAFGESLTAAVEVRLYTETWLPMVFQPHRRAEGFEFDHVPMGRYNVQAGAPGYKKASDMVELTEFGPNAAVILFLRKEGSNSMFPGAAEPTTVTPKAQKETEKALHDLQTNKIEDARKHFLAALQAAPGSANLNYLVGMTYVWKNSSPEAKPFLEKSISLDPNYAPSRLALGYILAQQGDAIGTIEVLDKVSQLPTATWQVHWIIASAYLRQGKFADARDHARRAIELGGEKAVGAQVVLAQALDRLGEREEALNVLAAYVAAHPKDTAVEELRRKIAARPRAAPHTTPQADAALASAGPSGVPEPLAPASSIPVLSPEALFNGNPWAPPDVDALKPVITPGASCALPSILQRAGKRALQLVTDLQQFSATEQYQSVERKSDGTLRAPVTAEFSYLVDFHVVKSAALQTMESRSQNGREAELPDAIQDLGSPAMVLLFHPDYQADFEMKCEGLSTWKGHSTWIVRFEQRTDRPNRISSIHFGDSYFPVFWKGRAWISASDDQVLHLESEMLQPIGPIQLKRQHLSIDYQPVAFERRDVELWLPQEVDAYLDFRGRSYHHYHRFTNFKLFWVGSTQKISDPAQKQN
jgi:tetratricopeptide (TPR) repeat protein